MTSEKRTRTVNMEKDMTKLARGKRQMRSPAAPAPCATPPSRSARSAPTSSIPAEPAATARGPSTSPPRRPSSSRARGWASPSTATAASAAAPAAPTLTPWFRALGVEYEIAPLDAPPEEKLPLSCFRCAWLRRKALFLAADRHGCNKVAFGHHADDAAVTTLMSLLYKGQLERLAPRLDYFDGHFEVIRPLIYAPQKEIAHYARAAGWALPADQEQVCPREGQTRRDKIERFLASFPDQEREQMRANLWRVSESADERMSE